MKKNRFYLSKILLCGCSLAFFAYPPELKMEKNFPAKKTVKIIMSSGDCQIRTVKSGGISLKIFHNYAEDMYTPEFKEEGDTLVLREDFSSHSGFFNKSARWELTVPEETRLNCNTASGDLDIQGIRSELNIHTASGDAELEDIEGSVTISIASGDVKISNTKGSLKIASASGDVNLAEAEGEKIEVATASGDIHIESIKGALRLKGASGDVHAAGLTITGESSCSTASGDVFAELASPLSHDLTISSASGDASLDFNGQPMKGEFVLITKKHGGDISAPVKFDKSEEFEEYGNTYIRKSFTRGSVTPKITVRTSSGDVSLQE